MPLGADPTASCSNERSRKSIQAVRSCVVCAELVLYTLPPRHHTHTQRCPRQTLNLQDSAVRTASPAMNIRKGAGGRTSSEPHDPANFEDLPVVGLEEMLLRCVGWLRDCWGRWERMGPSKEPSSYHTLLNVAWVQGIAEVRRAVQPCPYHEEREHKQSRTKGAGRGELPGWQRSNCRWGQPVRPGRPQAA